jgi:hypothetical protein
MLRGRLNREFRHETASDTGSAYFSDVCLFADVIMPSAERAGNHRPMTLLTRSCREMKIIRFGIRSVHQGSIPGHRRCGFRLDAPNHYSLQQLEAQTLFQALRIACTKDHLTGNFANLRKSEHPGGFFLNRAARAEAAAALLLEGKAALTI